MCGPETARMISRNLKQLEEEPEEDEAEEEQDSKPKAI